jgi:hypothetical protein
MTYDTHSNPYIQQTGMGTTGLGAVGGPRGVAAGGLRILIEFLTTYNPGAIKQVQADLAKLDRVQAQQAGKDQARIQRLQGVQTQLVQNQAVVRSKFTADERKRLKEAEALAQTGSRKDKAAALAQIQGIYNTAEASGKITKAQKKQLEENNKLKQAEVRLTQQVAAAEERQHARTKKRVETEGTLVQLQSAGSKIAGRIGGLAIGALGGIIGGAVLGVGFALAQQGLEAVGAAIQDLIDPARHAREYVDELGQAVSKVASQQNLSLLDAAKAYMKGLGLAANEATAEMLAQAAAASQGKDAVDAWVKSQQILLHPETVSGKDQIQQIENIIKEADKAAGVLKTVERRVTGQKTSGVEIVADEQYYYNKALEQYNIILGNISGNAAAAASAQQQLDWANRQTAASAALAAIAYEQFSTALDEAAGRQIAGLEAQMGSGGGGGESARARQIQNEIKKLQGRNAAEQLELLLLKQRLALLGKNINLEEYSGKFLIVAIEAKIAALQKEGEAQDKIMQLQDLQYRESREQRRNEGESIKEYQERIAQENAAFLKEHADLQRQDEIDTLQDLQDRTQLELDIEEAKKNAKIEMLQEELAAIQKAAAGGLSAKQKALQAEIQAIKDKVSEAKRLTSEQNYDEFMLAVEGAKNMTQFMQLQGRIQGLEAAKQTIEALVTAFGMDPSVAGPMLAKINKMLAAAYGKEQKLEGTTKKPGIGKPIPLASGGIFPLSNASTVFGSNIRTGEQGPEVGMVLSNKVAQALRNTQPTSFGDFYIQGSGDFYRDKYALKTMIRELLREEIH